MADLGSALRQAYAKARLTWHGLSDVGIPTGAQVLLNTARMRSPGIHEGAGHRLLHLRSARLEMWHAPGKLIGATYDTGEAIFEFDYATLNVSFLGPDMLRITWQPGGLPSAYALSSDQQCREAQDIPAPSPCVARCAVASDGERWRLSTELLTVEVASDGSLDTLSATGTPLRHDEPPLRRGSTWKLRHSLRAGERICGLGEQAQRLDLRGTTHRLWNRDPGGAYGPGRDPLYCGIPVVLGIHHDGSLLAFYENSTESNMDFGSPDAARSVPATATITFADGALRYYLSAGELPELLDSYTALTGRAPLPPRWALGYHQSRWGYRSEADVREVATGFARLGLPLSAIHLDIDYMDGYRVFTADEGRFGNLAQLASDLSRSGIRLVAIIDPGVKVDPAFPLYTEGRHGGHFCADRFGREAHGVVWPGRAAFPDFTAPATRDWWATQYGFIRDKGIAGVWHDMNEPTSMALVGDRTLPRSTRHDFDGRGGDHSEAHNLYGMLMDRAGYEGLQRARPEGRPFIVSRSGWAGMQRWSWIWTGDVETSWQALRQQVATVVGLGLSGVPFAGSDIGGFAGIPDDELYIRWLQLGVMMPFCRTHSVVGVPPREPWRFHEPARSAICSLIELRYRILPYLYTLAHEASTTGAPMVRPLAWPISTTEATIPTADARAGQEPEPDLWSVDDEFMLGSALLVAPVTEKGARTRDVLLPEGSWLYIGGGIDGRGGMGGDHDSQINGSNSSGTPMTGPGMLRVDAPLENIPLLVRAGSIIPLDDIWASGMGRGVTGLETTLANAGLNHGIDREGSEGREGSEDRRIGPGLAHSPELLSFHCWPDPSGHAIGACYDDPGDGYGPYRLNRLELSGAVPGATALLRWDHEGEFPPPDRVRVVLHGVELRSARFDGTEVQVHRGALICSPFTVLELEISATADHS